MSPLKNPKIIYFPNFSAKSTRKHEPRAKFQQSTLRGNGRIDTGSDWRAHRSLRRSSCDGRQSEFQRDETLSRRLWQKCECRCGGFLFGHEYCWNCYRVESKKVWRDVEIGRGVKITFLIFFLCFCESFWEIENLEKIIGFFYMTCKLTLEVLQLDFGDLQVDLSFFALFQSKLNFKLNYER